MFVPFHADGIISQFAGYELSAMRLLGLARLGVRHGAFGADPHDYHNEDHVLELGERRLGQLMDSLGFDEAWIGEHHFDFFGVVPSPPILRCGKNHGWSHHSLFR